MTRTQVRKLALSLPEATEEPHFAMWSFRVRGKKLAGLRVNLASARPAAVRELLHASWRRKAPKR